VWGLRGAGPGRGAMKNSKSGMRKTAGSLMWNLGHDLRDIHRLGPGFALRHMREALADKVYSMHVRGVGQVYLRKKSSDLSVLRQVFSGRQYDLSQSRQAARIRSRYQALLDSGLTPLIIDAGANNGASALWFASTFPQAHVAAIEPEPENCSICRMNIRGRETITLFQAAIGGTSGEVVLHGGGNKAWAVQTSREGSGDKVPVLTVADIVASFSPRHRLFLAKIDIEGFESDLFSHNTQWLEDVMTVMIEPHDWLLPGQYTSLPVQRAMARHRFELLLKGENLIYVRGPEEFISFSEAQSESALVPQA
jgi:FkbM family methyltransferase